SHPHIGSHAQSLLSDKRPHGSPSFLLRLWAALLPSEASDCFPLPTVSWGPGGYLAPSVVNFPSRVIDLKLALARGRVNSTVRRLSFSEENIAFESSPPNVSTTILGLR